jgi:hypothetical protein
VFKALEREPRRRWQNAASLRAALVAHAREYPPVTKSQLVTWVEWAFAQKQKSSEDSGLSALHEIIESAQIEAVPVEESIAAARLPATSAAVIERQRESVAAMQVGAPAAQREASAAIRVGAGMLGRQRPARTWPWIAGVVVAVALVALAVLAHFGVIAKPRL